MNPKFETYYNYLIAENQKYNLTAITEREDVFAKHFEDSLAGADLIPNGASVLDIGAGAGFPSVPLKIVRDDITVTMLDSVGKKVDFLNRLVGILELEGIEAIHTRIEDYRLGNREQGIGNSGGLGSNNSQKLSSKSYPLIPKHDIVVARAVASLNILCEYALPFVKVGGSFVAYKAVGVEDEIKAAQNAIKILGGKIAQVKQVSLECKGEKLERNLVVVTKVADTPPKYPRSGNKPRLQPL
ncbi:MAG: 16S rRNA (guanine(527)-N(7))-methyltransferase RsmG [Firmicutes bacterium]|nr:16S rRNA (guanine(527)-N(7))-methyltransferase RsmG [Bacillota bacterium]